MDTFPVIPLLIGLSVSSVKPAHRKTSAAGYTLSAAAGTVKKKVFVCQYKVNSATRDTVDTFFDDHQGGAFYLASPDPDDAATCTVVFDQDKIEWTALENTPGRWTGEIRFKEV